MRDHGATTQLHLSLAAITFLVAFSFLGETKEENVYYPLLGTVMLTLFYHTQVSVTLFSYPLLELMSHAIVAGDFNMLPSPNIDKLTRILLTPQHCLNGLLFMPARCLALEIPWVQTVYLFLLNL